MGGGVVKRPDLGGGRRRRGLLGVGAEAQVERVDVVVGRVSDRRVDARVGEVGLLDHQFAVIPGTSDADPVAGRRAGDRGHAGTVTELIGVGRAGGVQALLIDRRDRELGAQIGVRRVDSAVDHSDDRMGAVSDVPCPREVLGQEIPLPGDALCGVAHRQRRIVGQRPRHVAPLRRHRRNSRQPAQPAGEGRGRDARGWTHGDQPELRDRSARRPRPQPRDVGAHRGGGRRGGPGAIQQHQQRTGPGVCVPAAGGLGRGHLRRGDRHRKPHEQSTPAHGPKA